MIYLWSFEKQRIPLFVSHRDHLDKLSMKTRKSIQKPMKKKLCMVTSLWLNMSLSCMCGHKPMIKHASQFFLIDHILYFIRKQPNKASVWLWTQMINLLNFIIFNFNQNIIVEIIYTTKQNVKTFVGLIYKLWNRSDSKMNEIS